MVDLEDGSGLEALRRTFGEDLRTGESVRDLHSRDEGFAVPRKPAAVLFVSSAEDAAAAVALCAHHRLPIVPYGTGSGQEGGVTAPRGGLAINTSRLDKILEINVEDQDCWVEAGVTRLALNRALQGTGLFFPVDPGADASLGGMAATGAAGTTTPRYGAMRENVIGLEVVLASGAVISTGSRARKSSSGYDLTRLFVGSEGTLGLITKVRLRLYPLPEAAMAVRASFQTVDAAVRAATTMLASAVPLARAELMDAQAVRGLRIANLTDLPELPVALFEVQGTANSLLEAVESVSEFCEAEGALHIEVARLQEDMTRLWALRHGVAEAEKRLRLGATVVVTDVAVPVSRLPEIVALAADELAERGLIAVVSGHIADGNVHHALLIAPDDEDEAERAKGFKRWLAEQAVAMGGTISGEHGIGVGKRDLMPMAHGEALNVMRAIKRALDPSNLLNPEKVLPA